MPGIAMWFLKRYDIGKLLAKIGGSGGVFLGTHLVTLTTTPQYASWWAKIYMTPPQITNVPAFEKMVTFYFLVGWLALEHFYQRMEAPSATPTEGVKP